MALREYLQEQERALLKQLDDLRAEIGALQLKLIPVEAELAEVRRAAAAIGMPSDPTSSETVGFGSLGSLARLTGLFGLPNPGGFESAGNESPPNLPADVIAHSELGYAALVAADSAIPRANAAAEKTLTDFPQRSPSPYAHLTMKQLVTKALFEHFQSGATTHQLLDFFRFAWGRTVERTSLSPQLSRLVQEEIIERQSDMWRLTDRGALETQLKLAGHWPEEARWNPGGDKGTADLAAIMASNATDPKVREEINERLTSPEHQARLAALKKLLP